jgi:hypothetical protein
MNQQHILRIAALDLDRLVNASWLHQITTFIVTFVFVMGPRLPHLAGRYADTIMAISILLLLLAPSWIQNASVPTSLIKYVICLLFLAAYAGLVTVANSSVDLFSFLRSGRALLNFLAAISLVLLYTRLFGPNFPNALIRNVYWAISLHGLIIFFQFLSPDFREIVYRFTEPGVPPVIRNYRMAGFTNGGGAGASFIQAIPIIMTPIILSRAKKTLTRSFVTIAFIINLLAIIVTGKTGLYLSIVFLPITFFAYNWIFARTDFHSVDIHNGRAQKTSQDRILQTKSLTSSRKGSRQLRNILTLFLVATVVYISFTLFPSTQQEVFVNRSFRRTMGPFIGVLQEGEFRDPTVESLMSRHYFLPSDPIVFLFGNSNSGRADLGYIPSDVGYVRLWFALGLIGTLLMVGFYIMLMFDAWRARSYHAE